MQTDKVAGLANTDKKIAIDIEVNNKPVVLHQRAVTGHGIKAAAIEQHVAIELDFLLYIVHDQGQLDPVQDDEKVEVHKHERFRAVTPDDVSEA